MAHTARARHNPAIDPDGQSRRYVSIILCRGAMVLCMMAGEAFWVSALAQPTDLSLSSVRRASSQAHNDTWTMTQLLAAEFATSRQQPRQALQLYQPLVGQGEQPALNERALRLALMLQDWPTALHITQAWNQAYPDDIPAMFYLAHLALRNRQYALAAQTLDRIIAHDPQADLAGILKGIYPESPQERNRMLQALAVSVHANNPSLLVLLAGLEAQQEQYASALRKVNQALRVRPHVPSFILLKARLYLASGQTAQALRWLDQRSQRLATPDVALFEIHQLIQLQRPILAQRKLTTLLQRWPNHPDVLQLAARYALDKQRFRQAERYLHQLTRHPAYADQAYIELARLAEQGRQWQRAMHWYAQVEGSLYQLSRTQMTSLALQLHQTDDLMRRLTQERISYPNQAGFLYQLQIQILQQLGQTAQALALADEAIQQLPDDSQLLYAQVLLLNPKQDQERLDRILNHLLELEPDNPTFLNAYAYILAQQRRQLDLARQYAEQAVAAAPDQAAIRDTLGFIHYLQGHYADAIQQLSAAFAQSPSAGIGTRLAQALYSHGDQAQFIQLRQQLQQSYPTDPAVNALLELAIAPPAQVSPSSLSSAHASL